MASFFSGKKIVVTGGCGFIGSHLVEALVHEGARVTVVDDLSTGALENIKSVAESVEFLQGDVTDAALLDRAFVGAYGVLHHAAFVSVPGSVERPAESERINVGGMISVLEAVRRSGVDRVIFASSSAVYGDSSDLPKKESMPPAPISPYGIQKFACELYASAYQRLHGVKTIGLRYFNVFGPRQNPASEYAAVIPKFISRMKEGKSPLIFGDGSQTRDFTSVSTIVKANLKALEANRGFGDVYNIATGNSISLNELVRSINHELGASIEPEYAPARTGDVVHSAADISKAQHVLGFVPDESFETGIKKTVDSIA